MRTLGLIAFLLLLIFFQINGEKIPVNEGAFGDGLFYRDVGRFFLDDMEKSGYNLVQLTRILPFALLNLSFSALHLVKDNEGLQHGMIIWQLVFLGISIYWYFRIVKKLRLKPALMTIGFILLFFNYAWLKNVWYHPFTPDMMAFALGMGQANYFLRYEKFKLGMVSILGAFVSPLLMLSGILMLFLPGDKLPLYEGQRPKNLLPAIIALVLPMAFALLGWTIWAWGAQSWIAQILHLAAIIFVGALIIWAAKQNSINWSLAIAQLQKRSRSDRLSKGIMAMAGMLLLLIMLSGENESLGLTRFLKELGNGALRFPGDLIINSVLFWGLPVLFTLIYLSRVIQESGKLGWSVVWILALGLVFLMFLKPSALAAWIPLWVVVVIKGIKRYRWEVKDLLLNALLAVLLSFYWLPINSPSLVQYLEKSSEVPAQTWAVQRLGIHYPELISLSALAILGLIFALIIAGMKWRRKKYMRQMV